MNTNAGWKCLSVREFIGQYNWENILPQADSEAIALVRKTWATWRIVKAEEFFAFNNWEGSATFIDSSGINLEPAVVFDLTLPTGQLWRCFNWSGESNNSSNKIDEIIQNAEEAVAAAEEFTLNDLSQLF